LNSRILEFDNNEEIIYAFLHREYSEMQKRFDIGRADYDFLVSGGVLLETRKEPVALISNDMGILRAWKFFLKGEGLKSNELKFIKRIGSEIFEEAKLPRKYKSY